MKRIISIILSLALTFSIFSISASASEFSLDEMSIGDLAEEELLKSVDPMQGLTSGMTRLCKDLDTRMLLEQQMAAFNSFMSGLQTVSLGLSLVNGTVSLLKLFGVIKSPEQQQMEMLQSIFEVITDIQETVNKIDKRTEDIQKSLVTQAAQSSYNFRMNRYDAFQTAWNTFFAANGPVDTMDRLMNEFQSEVNKKMIAYTESWQDGTGGPIRTLYSESGVAINSGKNMNGTSAELPKEPYFADNTASVAYSAVLPAEYISVVKEYIGVNSYFSLLQTAIEEGTKNAMAKKAVIFSDDSIYSKFDAMSDTEKNEMIAQLAKDFLDSAAYEAAYETANTSYKGVGTFANQVNSAYHTFSDTLFGSKGVTSPLESGLSKLAYTHGFEGEIKEEAAEICTYLSTVSIAYGEFDAFLASMDRGLWESQDELIKRTVNTAYYPICYHDCFITGYDNYCYPLNAVVGYDYLSFYGTYEYEFLGNRDCLDKAPVPQEWQVASYSPAVTGSEAKQIISNKLMLSEKDMALLYLYYEASTSDNSELNNFTDYIDYASGTVPKHEIEMSFTLFGKKVEGTYTIPLPTTYLTSSPVHTDLKGKTAAGEYRCTKNTKWDEALSWKNRYDECHLFGSCELNYKDVSEYLGWSHDKLTANTFETSPDAENLDSRIQNESVVFERGCANFQTKTKTLRNLVGAASNMILATPGESITYEFVAEKGQINTCEVRGQNYSMLYYSPVQPSKSNNTASALATRDWALICTCTVVLGGSIIVAAYISRKKRKESDV